MELHTHLWLTSPVQSAVSWGKEKVPNVEKSEYFEGWWEKVLLIVHV